jgi:hypothetical protein
MTTLAILQKWALDWIHCSFMHCENQNEYCVFVSLVEYTVYISFVCISVEEWILATEELAY